MLSVVLPFAPSRLCCVKIVNPNSPIVNPMHSPDIRQKFIELRAATHSIPKISSLLSVAQSTLRLWEKDDALEIARLRRIDWEDAEDRVGITLENRLRRMAEWIEGAEDELEKRHFDLMNNRDLMRFLRESRREYFRLRAMLFSAEHTMERTHRARAKANTLEGKAPRCPARKSNTADFESNPSDLNPLLINTPLQRCEPTEPSEHLTASAVSPSTLQPISNATDKIGQLADFPQTQSRPSNDLQQPESAMSHSTCVERPAFGAASSAEPPIPSPPSHPSEISNVKSEIPLAPSANPKTPEPEVTRGFTSQVPLNNQVPSSEPAVPTHNLNPNPNPNPNPNLNPTLTLNPNPNPSSASPRLCGETPPKKHKPYWLNGHYYQNPEYPEHIARAISSALSLRGKSSS
jgi:hypothetical protein